MKIFIGTCTQDGEVIATAAAKDYDDARDAIIDEMSDAMMEDEGDEDEFNARITRIAEGLKPKKGNYSEKVGSWTEPGSELTYQVQVARLRS